MTDNDAMPYSATRTSNDMTKIEWKGRSGEGRTFFYRWSETPLSGGFGWRFNVYRAEDPNPADDWFEVQVRAIGDDVAVVTMLSNKEREWFTNKGIALVMLREVKKLLGRKLFSSSAETQPWTSTEWQTEDAARVWRTLVNLGHAAWHDDLKRWELVEL